MKSEKLYALCRWCPGLLERSISLDINQDSADKSNKKIPQWCLRLDICTMYSKSDESKTNKCVYYAAQGLWNTAIRIH